MNKSKRKVLFILSLLLIILTSTSVKGWIDSSQSKTNEFKNKSGKTGNYVILNKYRKDSDNKPTTIKLSGAQFYLYKKNPSGGLDTQIGNLYYTDSNGMILVENLDDGEYYFSEDVPPYGYRFDEDTNGNPITKYPFQFIVDNGQKEIINVYNIALESILEVNKKIVNQSNNPLSQEQLNQEFEFAIRFSDGKSYDYYKNDPTSLTSVASGGTFKLKHNESAYFVGIPVGVQYQIIEQPIDNYILSSSTNLQSNMLVEGIKATFVNTYLDIDNNSSLIIKKDIVSQNPIDLNKEFEFKVSFSNNKSYSYYIDNINNIITINSGDTIKLKHQEQATFINLPLGLSFEVVEKDYTVDGYIANVESINGTLINKVNTVQFINYDTKGVISGGKGSLKISKSIVDNKAIDQTREFEFRITFDNNNTYNYLKSDGTSGVVKSFDIIKLKHNEHIIINDIPVNTKYTVEEINYMIDHYKPSIIMQSGRILEDHQTLINVVNWRSKQKLTVKKQVVNKNKDDIFEFDITINGIVSSFSLKDGEEKTFDLNYGDTYLVSEKDYYKDNYLQSIINGQGSINKSDIVVIQTNKWFYELVTRLDVDIDFNKEVIGDKPPKNDTFRFSLKPLNNAPMPSNNTNNEAIITLNGSGELKYENIVYTKPGVFYYSLKEIDDKISGYTYDKSEYIIELTVKKENGDLKYHIVVKKNSVSVQHIIFKNKYTTPKVIEPEKPKPIEPGKPGEIILATGLRNDKLILGITLLVMALSSSVILIGITLRSKKWKK